MKYSIDTSAILDGWLRYYPPDVFPALWEHLEDLIEAGDLGATEEVLFELEKKADAVFEWAKNCSGLFVPIDEEIQLAVASILADYEKLVDTRASRSTADPFVVALAMTNQCAVVTGERPTNSLERPNIPDVCSALKIECIDLLQLIRREGWKFNR